MKILTIKPLLALALLLSFQACVFEDFDEPPVRNLSELEGNTTIRQLKDMHTLGEDASAIMGENLVLEATVVGNDLTGSIFKELYLQDSTGGIVMRLDEVGLNGLFPIGAEVVIPLEGLYVGDFRNKYQLTVAGGERIPAALVPSTVFVADLPQPVEPTLLTIAELANPAVFDRYLSTLVAFDSLEFSGSDAGATFADVVNGQSLNRTFADCDGNELVTRTSSFADFAGELTPTGRGRVVGLLDVFIDTRQLVLRGLDDLDMAGPRCGAVVGNNLISIEELRAQYTGDDTEISGDTRIRGVVISDFEAGNQQSQNLVLQDGGSGIVIRFSSDHSFPLGTDLELAVSEQELSVFRGIMQVNNISIANATSNGIIPLPSPRQATVQEILDNGEAWESTLVEIDPATVSGGPTFGDDGVTVTDDSNGSIVIFSRFSNFADDAVPNGEGSVKAILSQFDETYQLQINDPSYVDVEGGMTGGEETEITAGELRDLFEGGASSVPADRFIQGVVISDLVNGNTNGQNVVLQTGESGIVVRFSAGHSFPLGQELKISISGQELSEFNNLLQVNGVPLDNADDLGAGNLPEPREATIAQILENAEAWESTLVVVEDVTFPNDEFFTPGPPSLELTDGTGTLLSFISSNAAFANQAIPDGPFTLTFVVTQFQDDYQALIRNLDDID